MVQVQRFELDVLSHRSVLLHVVGVCHQRGCEVVSLRYDRSGPGLPADQAAERMSLAVSGERQRVERLEHWLGRLVPVLEVRVLDDRVLEDRVLDVRPAGANSQP
jgi:acetolactate synthase small subunit